MDVRPRVEVRTEKGIITMEAPTLARLQTLERTVLDTMMDEQQRRSYHSLAVKDRQRYLSPFIDDNAYTYSILMLLAYVSKAPFPTDGKLLPYDDFVDFATPQLIQRMHEAVGQLKDMDPFALMNSELDAELGARMFGDAYINGTENPTTARYMAYASYLRNGGRKEDWMQFTETDIMLMLISENMTAKRDAKLTALETIDLLGKSLNGSGT